MGAQFEQLTYTSEVSLTLIVDDIARQRRDAASPSYADAGPMDLSSWLNALQRQTAPLVHSQAARDNLEAWLDEVQRHIDLESNPVPSLPGLFEESKLSAAGPSPAA